MGLYLFAGCGDGATMGIFVLDTSKTHCNTRTGLHGFAASNCPIESTTKYSTLSKSSSMRRTNPSSSLLLSHRRIPVESPGVRP